MQPNAPNRLFEPILRRYPEIESIVSSPESCSLMRDTTKLGLPSLDALHHVPAFMELIWRVRDAETRTQYDHFKSMVGSLDRHVMEELGYEQVSPGSPIATQMSPVFEEGAIYRHRSG